jgi:hypothetical protein
MKKLLIAAVAVGAGLTPITDAANYEAVPETGTIAFDVFRGDSHFGTHILRFEEAGDRLRVVSDVDLRVRLGPITVFRYEHDSTEVYEDGTLVSFESTTLKDGEELIVDLSRQGETLAGRGSAEDGASLDIALPAGLPLSSHWQGYASGTRTILNTETGQEMPVTVTELGEETIQINDQPVLARHIRLEGSLTLDLWYDGDGEWIRTRFSARGQDITYVRRNI